MQRTLDAVDAGITLCSGVGPRILRLDATLAVLHSSSVVRSASVKLSVIFAWDFMSHHLLSAGFFSRPNPACALRLATLMLTCPIYYRRLQWQSGRNTGMSTSNFTVL